MAGVPHPVRAPSGYSGPAGVQLGGIGMILGGGAGGALRVLVEAPGLGVQRDAAPDRALLARRHAGPVLHLVEGAAAALALVVALGRRADRDAGRVRRRFVP